MNIGRFDTFENEAEITDMVKKLQAKGLEHMAVPDSLWDTKKHAIALKSTRKMGKRVLASL